MKENAIRILLGLLHLSVIKTTGPITAMNRIEILRRYIDPQDLGLEIGPSYNPIAPKSGGFRVHVADYLSTENLRNHYSAHNVDVSKIEEVDFVLEGKGLDCVLEAGHRYRWILASHVIEHSTDILRFLKSCSRLLDDQGVLTLAIPDKRFCFDRFRPLTSLGRVIDAHLTNPKIHTEGSVAEYFLTVVRNHDSIAWTAGQYPSSNYSFVHDQAEAIRSLGYVRDNKWYLDVHAWVFVPASFRLLIEDLCALDYLDLEVFDFVPTIHHEFFVFLRRRSAKPTYDRMQMLNEIEKELAEAR